MSIDFGTDLAIAGALLGGAGPIAHAVLADLGGLVAGTPIAIPPTKVRVGKYDVTITGKIALAKTQDVHNPSVFELFGDLLTDGSALAAGQGVTLPTLTERLGTVWLDETFTLTLSPLPAA